MQDNLFLHFIALICTWLNAKFHAKYTLKQVQGNKFLVQNSAKFGTKVQEQSSISQYYKSASISLNISVLGIKQPFKLDSVI